MTAKCLGNEYMRFSEYENLRDKLEETLEDTKERRVLTRGYNFSEHR